MSDLLVECPIHLDAVLITDILVFKCGHGFCEPCLEAHFAHHAQSGHPLCPTCRKPVKRREAFPLFLSPAHSSSAGSDPAREASHTRMMKELKEARAAHENCPERFRELQHEIDTLRKDDAYHNQTIQHLRHRYDLLEESLAREADNSARARERSDRMEEELMKLQVENHKSKASLDQALKDLQVQLERVKTFQGYIDQYKRKCNLERKKRKAIEDTSRRLLPKKEDDSLMVVDSNAADILYQDGHDFEWLDEACRVKGDPLGVPGDEDLASEGVSEDEVQFSDLDANEKEKVDQVQGPQLRFYSDWNLGPETLAGTSSGIPRKQRHVNRPPGGSRIVKVKTSGPKGNKPSHGPLAVDRRGHIRGTVVLGSRQRLNSKN